MRVLFTFSLASALVSLVSCSPVGKSTSILASSNSSRSIAPQPGPAPSTPEPAQPRPGPSPAAASKLGLCSKLDFNGVNWSQTLPLIEREMLQLALNITGSFEGHNSWGTLTGNFDGQGLSMGLLQQNLGQGSLQPLWADMESSSLATMKGIFSSANLTNLLAMLDHWRAAVSPAAVHLADYGYSELDDMQSVAHEMGVTASDLQAVQTALLARNQAAVDWAAQTLYSSGNFKSDWKAQLAGFATTAGYRSLQVGRAEHLHSSAMEMLAAFQMHELRSYLFFFDIAVQNGGLSSTLRSDYAAWFKTHTSASEAERLGQILLLRLKVVRAQYVGDVRARKSTLITGHGIVHGESRSLEKEYCVSFASRI